MIVAFIGLGAMGRPMAFRLLAAGHGVAGCDIAATPQAEIEAAGGTFTTDPAKAAKGADALVLMVVSGAQARDVLFASGAAAALTRGALVIASCTQPRAEAAEMGERLAASGLRFLDAPVSGGVVGAEAGTLTVMASGPADTFAAARPILEAIGDKLHYMGEDWGLGSLAKTINQHLAGVHIAAAAEAMALGTGMGLDGSQMLDIYTRSAAGSWMLGNRGPRMLEDAPGVTSAVDIFVKDLGIVQDAAREAGARTPLADASLALFEEASAGGLGRADDSQVVQVLRPAGKEGT